MSVTVRDLAFGATALLAFPLVMTLTAVTSDGEGRDLDDPLFHRGGARDVPAATAGR